MTQIEKARLYKANRRILRVVFKQIENAYSQKENGESRLLKAIFKTR